MAADCNNLGQYTKQQLENNPTLVAEVVGCLTTKIDDAIRGMEKATSSAGAFTSKIGEGASFAGGIANSFASAYKTLGKFSTNLREQYKLSEDIAKSYKKISVNIGIGFENQERLGKSFTNSLALVRQLGGDFDDVTAIYEKFSENSGRVRILDPEEVERIFAIEKATGLMGTSAAALSERFDLMGIGSKQFADNINHIMVDSQKIGLNSSKVIKVLSDNFETMQRMSFKSGVKGMTEMSKLAVKMRMDISQMLGMADKFYEPEAAIEAAAQLQLMGGDIAEAFGDPFETMYLARNKPEELAKKLQGMTENMVAFNEETGQYELPAEARQQLSFAAEQLGLAKENVIDMAFQSSKMKDIKLSVGGDFTEEQLDKISSIAKYTDGQWKVDVDGESIAVDELDSTSLEKALAAPTTEKDAAIETAKAAMTTNELLESVVESGKVRIVAETGIYERTEEGVKPLLEGVRSFNEQLIEGVSGTIGVTIGDKIDKSLNVATGTVNLFRENVVGAATDFVKQFNKATPNIGKLLPDISTIGNKPNPTEEPVEDLYSPPTSSKRVLTGPFGSFKLDDRDGILSTDPNNFSNDNTKKLQESINTQSNQNVTHNGTIKVEIPTITFNMGDGNESVNLTPEQKKIVQNMVISNMVKGMNSNIQSGTGTDGTTNVLTPEY